MVSSGFAVLLITFIVFPCLWWRLVIDSAFGGGGGGGYSSFHSASKAVPIRSVNTASACQDL